MSILSFPRQPELLARHVLSWNQECYRFKQTLTPSATLSPEILQLGKSSRQITPHNSAALRTSVSQLPAGQGQIGRRASLKCGRPCGPSGYFTQALSLCHDTIWLAESQKMNPHGVSLALHFTDEGTKTPFLIFLAGP